MLTSLISILLSYIFILLGIAFYTLIERKFLGYFQLRKGPNKPGLIGLPQPFADAIKLFIKEQSKPSASNQIPFILAPTLRLTLALRIWVLFPHPYQPFFIPFGILFFLCVSSINVYATFLAGWCSNSKYALLGALRGVAQTISYEVRISLILICALILIFTIDITEINLNIGTPIFLLIIPISILWFITNLAETNRTPFDFAEGESELVSGFNVEYRAGIFALIFIAEYVSILGMRLISATIFLSYSVLPSINSLLIIVKTLFLAILFVWIRATLPRIRYDNLIYLTWKNFLPLALSTLIILSSILLIWYCAGRTDNSDDVNYGFIFPVSRSKS